MSEATMDDMNKAAGSESAHRASQVIDPLMGVLKNVWWFGLGAAAIIGEQGGKLALKVVEKGREYEPSVKREFKRAEEGVGHAMSGVGEKLKGFSGTVSQRTSKAGDVVEEKVAAAFQKMGIPSRREIQDLMEKVEELSAKLDQMRQSQSGQ